MCFRLLVMAKIVRPGTYVKVLTSANRIRHARVTAVTDQNNITVRLGTASTSASATLGADRLASTDTRGTLFTQE